jgi:hypothetical protein
VPVIGPILEAVLLRIASRRATAFEAERQRPGIAATEARAQGAGVVAPGKVVPMGLENGHDPGVPKRSERRVAGGRRA